MTYRILSFPVIVFQLSFNKQAEKKLDYKLFSSLKRKKKHTCMHIVKSNATNRAPDKKY